MRPGPATAALLLGLIPCRAHAPAQESGGEDRAHWLQTFVPRMGSAGAQLAHARRLKRELNGREGDELVFWRRLAVEGYQAVRAFHPEEQALGAEAAFRAGELLRAGGQEVDALEEFAWCKRHGAGTEFKARAGLEIGHLHRRNGRWKESREAYLDVAADAGAQASRREDAWLWLGVVWREQGRPDEARSAWLRVAREGSDDLLRIQAYDELACSALAQEDPEGAAGWLDECLARLSPRALEETQDGERVRNALLRMRIVDELPRALALRNRSSAERGTSRNS